MQLLGYYLKTDPNLRTSNFSTNLYTVQLHYMFRWQPQPPSSGKYTFTNQTATVEVNFPEGGGRHRQHLECSLTG